MNPTVRGFLIIALIALVVSYSRCRRRSISLFLLRIAFFLAIAFSATSSGATAPRGQRACGRPAQDVFYGAVALGRRLGVFFGSGRAGWTRWPSCSSSRRAARGRTAHLASGSAASGSSTARARLSRSER